MNPVVSIVVPFVNHSKFINSCWENLQNQTYKNIEVIFVDNGSMDDSCKLVEEIAAANQGKVILVSEKQKGIPFARNTGLSVANGKYISFLDVDDHFSDNKIEVLANELENQPQAAMAYGQTLRRYVESGREVIQDTGIASTGINHAPSLTFDWATTFYRLPQTGATLIKTSIAKEVGGFPTNLLMGNDDVGFHIKIALNHEIIFKPFVAVYYYRHNKSAGALLNDESSVHLRYIDAHLKSTSVLGYDYFRETGDIRLLGIARKGIFLNVLYYYYRDHKLSAPDNIRENLFLYYRLILFIFDVLPYAVAELIYKISRRIISMSGSDKYPI